MRSVFVCPNNGMAANASPGKNDSKCGQLIVVAVVLVVVGGGVGGGGGGGVCV